MTLSLLPDVIGMGVLLGILLYLWRIHSPRRVGYWLVGLAFIFVEAVAWMLYPPSGMWQRPLHVLSLDSLVVAGAVFLWSAADRPQRMRRMRLYAVLNTLPWLALATVYGMEVRWRPAYCVIATIGCALGVGMSVGQRKRGLLLGAQMSGWLPLAPLLYGGLYREAVYWGLAWGYAWVAVVFWRTLPRASTGRIAIVSGFTVWSACFLLHPWAAGGGLAKQMVAEFWSMQKFLVTVGMLLVLLEEQIRLSRRLSLLDELTTLPNRRLFEDRLTQDLARARRSGTRMGLLMLDMNGFKAINDTLGHEAGDVLLRQTANHLSAVVRRSDTLARLGGDEFTVIANDMADQESLRSVIASLSLAVNRPVIIQGQTVRLTASIGAAIYPDDSEDTATLRAIADRRMYAHKREQKAVATRVALDRGAEHKLMSFPA